MSVMGRPDNGPLADVLLERRGYRITRLEVEGQDLTRHCRRADIILDVNDGPLVKLELYARARIIDMDHDPLEDADQGIVWPDVDK